MSNKWWWLSFVDPKNRDNDGSAFLGACVVEGNDLIDAVKMAHKLGVNPGGDVTGLPVPEAKQAEFAKYKDRLVSQSELNDDGIFSERQKRAMN